MNTSFPKIITIFYFVLWIFIGNNIILNLFTAVLLNGKLKMIGFTDNNEFIDIQDDIEIKFIIPEENLINKVYFYIIFNIRIK